MPIVGPGTVTPNLAAFRTGVGSVRRPKPMNRKLARSKKYQRKLSAVIGYMMTTRLVMNIELPGYNQIVMTQRHVITCNVLYLLVGSSVDHVYSTSTKSLQKMYT